MPRLPGRAVGTGLHLNGGAARLHRGCIAAAPQHAHIVADPGLLGVQLETLQTGRQTQGCTIFEHQSLQLQGRFAQQALLARRHVQLRSLRRPDQQGDS
ncbi:hypothetical protein D9M71_346700 [compost metagenome]